MDRPAPFRPLCAIARLGLGAAIVALSGCTLLIQDPHTVYVRKAGDAHFDLSKEMLTEQKFRDSAAEHWELAVMSENAYHASDSFPLGAKQVERLAHCTSLGDDDKKTIGARTGSRTSTEFTDAQQRNLLEANGWVEWDSYDSAITAQTWCLAVEEAVAFRLYTKQTGDKVTVAISFRGTVGEYWPNWIASARWFIQWPRSRQDGNMVVQHAIADDLAKAIVTRYPDAARTPGALEIVTTGHSLGGAFAQQLAYAFPPVDYSFMQFPSLKISKVVVFNPSPVNGWYWVGKELRERNGGDLPVARVYQHGEILAYPRLLLGYLYPLSNGDVRDGKPTAPRISEIRYNAADARVENPSVLQQAKRTFGAPGGNHAMRSLAAFLATSAGHAPLNFPDADD